MAELYFQGSLYGFIAELFLWVIFAFIMMIVKIKQKKPWLDNFMTIILSLIFFFIITANFGFKKPNTEENIQTSHVSVK